MPKATPRKRTGGRQATQAAPSSTARPVPPKATAGKAPAKRPPAPPAAPVPANPAKPSRKGPKTGLQASQPTGKLPAPLPNEASAPYWAAQLGGLTAAVHGSLGVRDIPGVYGGHTNKLSQRIEAGFHSCIAYRQTEDKVFAVVIGPPIHLHEFNRLYFDATMKPLTLNLIGEQPVPYPMDRALKRYLESYGGHTDKALRVLRKLAAGKEPDEEDTLEDLLDATPTPAPTRKVHRQAATPSVRAATRAQRRQQKLAKMSEAELTAWKAKRKNARKARRAAKNGRAA